MLTLSINGTEYLIRTTISIYELLKFLGININRIALEHNNYIIQKNEYKSLFIKHQDKIEIVSIVGGG